MADRTRVAFHNAPQHKHNKPHIHSTTTTLLLIPTSIQAKYCSLEGSVHQIYKKRIIKALTWGSFVSTSLLLLPLLCCFFWAVTKQLFAGLAPPSGQEYESGVIGDKTHKPTLINQTH